jgi:hypothetical protein
MATKAPKKTTKQDPSKAAPASGDRRIDKVRKLLAKPQENQEKILDVLTDVAPADSVVLLRDLREALAAANVPPGLCSNMLLDLAFAEAEVGDFAAALRTLAAHEEASGGPGWQNHHAVVGRKALEAGQLEAAHDAYRRRTDAESWTGVVVTLAGLGRPIADAEAAALAVIDEEQARLRAAKDSRDTRRFRAEREVYRAAIAFAGKDVARAEAILDAARAELGADLVVENALLAAARKLPG